MYLCNRMLRNFKEFNITRTMAQIASKDLIQQDKIILKPLTYVQKSMYQPGHTAPLDIYRPFNYWLKVPEDKFAAIDKFMDMYQSAAVTCDDILDSTHYRYGMPAAHTVYGNAFTINSTHFGFLKAFEMITNLDPRAYKICMDAAFDFFRGQGLEIYWRDHLQCPTEEEYINVIRQKNCSFMILAYKLQHLFSDYKGDCTKLADDIGVYHQMLDDYKDVFVTETIDAKSCFTDVTEGKFTLPVIYAIKNSDSSEELLNILKLRTQDPQIKKWFISLLQKADSFEYTKHMLSKFETEIYDQIKRLGGNPVMTTALKNLGNWREIDSNQLVDQ